jgi:FtsP/CotA-like multicopper oxidase with cupredoxin domain
MGDRSTGTAFTRRQVLTASAVGLLGAGVVPALLSGCAPASPGVQLGVELRPPLVKASGGGRLEGTLTASRSTVDVGLGHRVDTFAYDGAIPGPTWEVRGGDVIGIRLQNDMPPLADAGADHHGGGESDAGAGVPDLTRPHEWTTTNLHTHGLHVSSTGRQDNPFITIHPHESRVYQIEVPVDHTGGLFWYHPHRHGGVAQQVGGGMAGALIVRGAIDEVPEVAAATEQVMVLQALHLGDDFELLDPIPNATRSEAFFPRTQSFWTINGQYRPKITMRQGEVQRWRMLNAAEGKLASLRLTGHELHHIAYDGYTLPQPRMVLDTFIVPGGRTEVLVKAGRPGVYELVLSPGSSQRPSVPGWQQAPSPSQRPGADGTVSPELVPRVVATVEVLADVDDMALPHQLPAFAPPLLPIAAERTVEYTVHRNDRGEFESFGIDHRPFSTTHPPYRMRLGTAEQWTVVNAADEGFVHVFHIHVNPFLVTHINGERLATPEWRDTYPLGPHLGDSFTFTMNLDDYAGMTVQHCHVLTHEDLGMMEAVEIV